MTTYHYDPRPLYECEDCGNLVRGRLHMSCPRCGSYMADPEVVEE